MLVYIILGMALHESLTGYDIKKRIENGIGVFYKASYGSLYPALRKLTEKGWLVMCEEPRGGRQKKFYSLTAAGEKVFMDWLVSPLNVLDGVNSHLAKVYFFDKLPPEIRDRQLLEHEVNNGNYLRKLQALRSGFNKMEQQDCFYFKLSTLYYGIRATQESIRWCRHIRAGKPLAELIQEGE